RLVTHYGNEYVGDAGRVNLAKRGQLITIAAIKDQGAPSKYLAFVHRLQGAGRGDLIGIDRDSDIPQLEFLHAAAQHDAAAIYEHQIREYVLQLFHLMRGHHNGAIAIEVVV